MEAEEIQNKDKNKTKYEILGVPGLIKIGDHNYVYKDQSKADKEKFFYRCQKRECRITIEINKDNLNKLNANDNKSKIEYKQKKEHKCKQEDIEKSEDENKCSSEEVLLLKAKNIIKKNPLKPLSYQQIKLHENNIHLSDIKIKKLLNNIRDANFPKDSEYLSNINNITITFDEKIKNSRELPFCLNNTKFYNPKKNRIEQFIIFSSKFHLQFLGETTHLFVDATFKIAPKNFYQVLNILSRNEKTNFTVPVAFVLMTSKTYESYLKIFQELKFIIQNYGIKFEPKGVKFICDFEKSLLGALKKEFEQGIINGCYFHYIKSLWKKVRKLGLTKSKYLENTKILIFALKIYPFIQKENKEIILMKYMFILNQ